MTRLMLINITAAIAIRSDNVQARGSTLGLSINSSEHTLPPELHRFFFRFIGTVTLTLVPVIFIAFMSMPINLNRHPGEPVPTDLPPRHMT